jgi:hypothetical protein
MPATQPTSEVHALLNGKDDQNRPIFSVLVKRSYDIVPGGQAVRAETPRPFVEADQYYDEGDPEWATVKYETDFAAFKLATDVVLIGRAFAPLGKPVPQLEASIEVAGRRKVLRITGDRRCLYQPRGAPRFTDPVPFTEMPIQYERAYGGKDTQSNPQEPFYYPRNYLGAGVALKNVKESIDALSLPNVEDPTDLLTPERMVIGEPDRWYQQPLPDGLGWFQRTWYPRCSFVGAIPAYLGVDTVLPEEKLGLVPKHQIALWQQLKLPSFDARFNSGASRGLVLPYLAGNEAVRLENLTRDGHITFQLPGETPQMMLDIGLGENQLKPVLQTVSIRLEEMQVDLVWRGAHEYPGFDWLPEMKKTVVAVN